jgi:hypothetical protein
VDAPGTSRRVDHDLHRGTSRRNTQALVERPSAAAVA